MSWADDPTSGRLDTLSTTLPSHPTGRRSDAPKSFSFYSLLNTSLSLVSSRFSNNQSKDHVPGKARGFRITWSSDFRIESYSIDNPPPLRSRKEGIPPCALGYAVDDEWLVKYAHEHRLVRKPDNPHVSTSPSNKAVLYLLEKLQQELYCSRPDDESLFIIFYAGTNMSESSLKRAINPERIALFRRFLG
ncbi:hypothetical protein C8Q75DRAFT_805672 [Abortiporus biennis]|nr:hypothetical protein C8Q75DRAFT_805672 [Abortiporus biennis]